MICPVCEHQQDFGMECDVCGKDLGGLDALGPPPVMAQRIEGLEATMSESVGEIAVERMGDLEVSRFDAVNVVAERTPDLESTTQAPVGEVAVEKMVDLAVDRVPDDGSRTPLPQGPVTCRYCRHVQAQGSMCDRCGMKLPVIIVVPEGVIGGTLIGSQEPVKARCRACGAPATAGERCGDCGKEVPFPDA